MEEQEVARRIEGHLSSEGWEVYKEVPAPSRNKVVDLYAVKGVPENPRDSLAVEAKSTCSIRVIQQAEFWSRRAHRSAIAVPDSDNRRQREFAARICNQFDLGFFEVSSEEVRSTRPAEKSGMGIQVPDLYEEQKDAVAGTDDPDDRHTELDRTVEKVKDAIPEGKYARLDEVVGRIDHHYSSDRSAASSIKEHIRSGRIEGLSIRWRGAYLIKSE
jgi:hypothetical protein